MIAELQNPFSLWKRKVKFRFDNFSWLKMCDLLGIDFEEMDKLSEVQLVPVWMYAAYLSNCTHNYKKPWMSYKHIEKIYKWYYVNDIKTLEELQKAMMSTKLLGRTMQDWAKDHQKKK